MRRLQYLIGPILLMVLCACLSTSITAATNPSPALPFIRGGRHFGGLPYFVRGESKIVPLLTKEEQLSNPLLTKEGAGGGWLGALSPAATCEQPDFENWGKEALARIQAEYARTDGLYADEIAVSKGPSQQPAFMWGCGVQVTALAAAARLDSATYLPILRRFLKAMDAYWIEHNGLYGYNALPKPSPPDRYYDDNTWMALALLEVYDLTHEQAYLDRAEQTFRFVLSGEDNQLGGGIFWSENQRNLKGTDPNGAVSVAALRLYQLTGKESYLQTARRLYAWTNAHLQDKDGLFFDALELNGKLHPAKWTYNAALMLRANCLFYGVTHDKKYLQEAERIAAAAEKQWVRSDTGAMADYGPFAHLLCEAYLFLYDQDNDPHWLTIVQHALVFLHDHTRDPAGYYGKDWGTPVTAPLQKVPLLSEASAARAFCMVARYPILGFRLWILD